MIYAAGHDPATFVLYSQDAPTYIKVVFSVAEQDALMSALLTHWRANGRDVSLCERFAEETPDG